MKEYSKPLLEVEFVDVEDILSISKLGEVKEFDWGSLDWEEWE